MYLIYGKDDNKVWREVHNFVREDGQIRAGVNGTYTLIYPDNVNVDVFELSDAEYAKLDTEHINRYMIHDGAVVEDPDYVAPVLSDASEYELLAAAVAQGKITPEQYAEITGAEYAQ